MIMLAIYEDDNDDNYDFNDDDAVMMVLVISIMVTMEVMMFVYIEDTARFRSVCGEYRGRCPGLNLLFAARISEWHFQNLSKPTRWGHCPILVAGREHLLGEQAWSWVL